MFETHLQHRPRRVARVADSISSITKGGTGQMRLQSVKRHLTSSSLLRLAPRPSRSICRLPQPLVAIPELGPRALVDPGAKTKACSV
jgi:hypothetical protein